MGRENRNSSVRRLEAAAGVCCFIAGILAAVLGSLVTASGWILGVEVHPWIRGAGTGLLIVTIPLILFAGFFLDWAERSPTKPNDNDRHQGQGKAPEPIMISKEIKRGFEEAGVTRDKEIRLGAVGTR
jgi:hypothetical protein